MSDDFKPVEQSVEHRRPPEQRAGQQVEIHSRLDDSAKNSSDDGATRPTWLSISILAIGSSAVLAGCFLLYKGPNIAGVIPAIIGGGLIAATLGVKAPISFDRYAEQIRNRVDDSPNEGVKVFVEPGATANIQGTAADPAAARVSDNLEKQEAILREIYTQGLAQAKVSFRVSVVFMTLGAGILIAGGALAIFRAPTDGEKYASVIVTVAGVVVNLTSTVFFVQSNRARKNMGDQGVLMREESQEDRRLSAAREIAAAIDDFDLRNSVRADLARRLLNVDDPSKDKDEQNSSADQKVSADQQ